MEFQAIIMAAGTGSRMREITSSIPKCLLPVGNIPLILCSINTLKRAGFREAIVLVQETEKVKIQNAIEGKLDIKLDIVPVPKNEDWGTADSLRYIEDKIKSDVLVVSCDLISDFNLQNMANLHRSESSSLTMLLVPSLKVLQEMDMPGSKKKYKCERDIVGLDSSGQLTFISSEADFEQGVPLKLSILKQYPYLKIYSNLLDAHVYMIKKDLVSYIINNKNISTLKGEFLPSAVKTQFSCNSHAIKADSNDISHLNTPMNKFQDLKKLALELSSYQEENGFKKLSDNTGIRCFAYIDKNSFCTRVNTLVAYANINQKIAKHFNMITGLPPKPHQFQKSQVDHESIICENCELLAKASIKQSVIGNSCKFDEKTKISHSVIMENVRIGKECTIQGSIVCSNVTIEDQCSIKNCIIGPDQTVKELSKLSNESLENADQLLEI